MDMLLTEIFGEPTPEFEVWTTAQWAASISAMLIGLMLVAFWPYVSAALVEINDRVRLPAWLYVPLAVVGVLGLIALVVYAVFFAPWLMPRAMDTSIWIRLIPGALVVLAGVKGALYAHAQNAPVGVLVTLVGVLVGFVGLGLVNDYFSRLASGIPMAVAGLYALMMVVVMIFVAKLSTR